MKIRKLILILFVFLIYYPFIWAQKFHTSSSRAINAYNQGKRDYEFLYFESAESYLKEAIKI
ncbi:MAG TPA: hypothetical protein PL101_10230, partial [Bacteroidales bacterium]|nr:hypothetical protein [Bacteroidales bacterium]